MKKAPLFLLLILTLNSVYGQEKMLDSLKRELRQVTSDTSRINLIITLGNIYFYVMPDSSLKYFKMGVDLIHQSNIVVGRATVLNRAGDAARVLGNYPEALKYQFEALELARTRKSNSQIRNGLQFIGHTYLEFGEYRQALNYYRQSFQLDTALQSQDGLLWESFGLTNIGRCYSSLGRYDSALLYLKRANSAFDKGAGEDHLYVLLMAELGNVYQSLGKYDSAIYYLRMGAKKVRDIGGSIQFSRVLLRSAEVFYDTGPKDSAFYFARATLKEARRTFQRLKIMEAATLLQKLHLEEKNTDSAYHYLDLAVAMKDTLYGADKYKQLQLLMLSEQEREQKVLQEQDRLRNRMRTIFLLSSLAVLIIIVLLLFYNNRMKQKAKVKIEQAYADLKATQSQLIQSEKMASLGELTVGIAHEIQNPLNFVNNFSELNAELVNELEVAVVNGDLEEVKFLVKDIKENEQKINQHGKRAGGIVRGMLQHGRTSTGKKEPTDINALCDEYLRIAYHGYRAKDSSFTASVETDVDPNLPPINVVPQDIGRIILNLVNNAFYAVNEKRKTAGEKYEPSVTVCTRKLKGGLEIKVRDNGGGIPLPIREKIFQPFFTTKPTGHGTGLGLSLSYDMVKAHGGELKMETEEGHGTSFTILLAV
jgi:signal transduction histidine kinase